MDERIRFRLSRVTAQRVGLLSRNACRGFDVFVENETKRHVDFSACRERAPFLWVQFVLGARNDAFTGRLRRSLRHAAGVVDGAMKEADRG